MPNKDTASHVPIREKETTLREAVVGRIEVFFELHGLDAAIKKFDDMKIDFSCCHDWPDIEKDVLKFLIEKKHEAELADFNRQQKIDEAMVVGFAKGINGGQMNLLTGTNSQAPFYSSTPTLGGHK